MLGGSQKLTKDKGTSEDFRYRSPVPCTKAPRKLTVSLQRGCIEEFDDCGFYFKCFAQGWPEEVTNKLITHNKETVAKNFRAENI